MLWTRQILLCLYIGRFDPLLYILGRGKVDSQHQSNLHGIDGCLLTLISFARDGWMHLFNISCSPRTRRLILLSLSESKSLFGAIRSSITFCSSPISLLPFVFIFGLVFHLHLLIWSHHLLIILDQQVVFILCLSLLLPLTLDYNIQQIIK